MTDDLNGAEALDFLDLEADAPDEPDDDLDRAAYVRALVTHPCPELANDDLAMLSVSADDLEVLSQLEPLGEMIPVAVADQILDVVMALDDRMAKLEATVLAGNDLIASLWTAMVDYPLEAKQAMLERLEGLVAMEEASHAPIQ